MLWLYILIVIAILAYSPPLMVIGAGFIIIYFDLIPNTKKSPNKIKIQAYTEDVGGRFDDRNIKFLDDMVVSERSDTVKL